MKEKDLEQQFKMYTELAAKDKNIDVASLMAAALEKPEGSSLSARQKRLAYLISLGLPPFGLIYAAKFWFSDKDDARNAALMCTVLTVLSLFIMFLMVSMILSGSGLTSNDLQQIENINPADIRSLYE